MMLDLAYDYEMVLIDSIEVKDLFECYELEGLEEYDTLPLNGGFHIVEDLDQYLPELEDEKLDELVKKLQIKID